MNNKELFFSIVVPIYNVDKYLHDCIDSILGQTYKNFELILVDDGSTDHSPHICDLYAEKDSRIKVIHKQNGGLVSARKAGAAIATGDYAICVDSDDWIDKDHLLSLYDVINKYSPDIVCFDYFEVLNDLYAVKKNPFRKGFYNENQIINEILPNLIETRKAFYFPPCIWGKAYKMDLYKAEQLQVDDQIKIGEDVACTIPCISKSNSIFILDKPLYYYRRNNLSMTKNKKPFSWLSPELIELHLKKRINTNNYKFSDQISRRTVHSVLMVAKTQFYQNKKYSIVSSEINQELKKPIFNDAIKNSKFCPFTALAFFHFCLKHKFLFPIYLLSKIR